MPVSIYVVHGHDESGPFDALSDAIRFLVATKRHTSDVRLVFRVQAGKSVVTFHPADTEKDTFALIHEQLKDANP